MNVDSIWYVAFALGWICSILIFFFLIPYIKRAWEKFKIKQTMGYIGG